MDIGSLLELRDMKEAIKQPAFWSALVLLVAAVAAAMVLTGPAIAMVAVPLLLASAVSGFFTAFEKKDSSQSWLGVLTNWLFAEEAPGKTKKIQHFAAPAATLSAGAGVAAAGGGAANDARISVIAESEVAAESVGIERHLADVEITLLQYLQQDATKRREGKKKFPSSFMGSLKLPPEVNEYVDKLFSKKTGLTDWSIEGTKKEYKEKLLTLYKEVKQGTTINFAALQESSKGKGKQAKKSKAATALSPPLADEGAGAALPEWAGILIKRFAERGARIKNAAEGGAELAKTAKSFAEGTTAARKSAAMGNLSLSVDHGNLRCKQAIQDDFPADLQISDISLPEKITKKASGQGLQAAHQAKI
jgi:hypothetical protein